MVDFIEFRKFLLEFNRKNIIIPLEEYLKDDRKVEISIDSNTSSGSTKNSAKESQNTQKVSKGNDNSSKPKPN